MEKKIKFSDKPLTVKIIYASVVAILCITAIIVGIVAAASRPNDTPVDDPTVENPDNNDNADGNKDEEKPAEPKPLAFVSPLVGRVTTAHDLSAPVFSNTLGAWRVHTGIDISAEEGASVYASEAGEISGIYSDPMLGYTVEILHEGGVKTRYSNLAKDGTSSLKVGDSVKSGDVIGKIGDTSTSELAEEPHLHFELLVDGKKMDPLDYITKESKKASLGITEE